MEIAVHIHITAKGLIYINNSPRHLLSRLHQLFCFTIFSSFSSRFKRKELREKWLENSAVVLG